MEGGRLEMGDEVGMGVGLSRGRMYIREEGNRKDEGRVRMVQAR